MEEKMKLLCQAGVIDEDIFRGMLQVIDDLETRWGRPLPEEQGWMAIAHMANALMRSRRGEIIAPLGEDFLQEIAASGELPHLRRLNDGLLAKFSVRLHPNEEGYLLANLFGLSPQQRH
ncbi:MULTISPECIES: hypothetical protein [Serratia]|uniref:hypothetical protein n=1 Tax=Serratia TaxID=613 RepID=UPI000744F01C|nr:hypothetical protein [Serratia marcescens]EME1467470.1 hypothetical protein [Serratia marcescens]MBH3048813.1 hypothetical protein [Serratia marcescens]MBH3148978.1 hypothetical protein [Serratia marcescens]MBN3903284.1 hypothetical protein [Serratia marcescens]MBN3914203.1 hypothetical protein [Serratia marcescens]